MLFHIATPRHAYHAMPLICLPRTRRMMPLIAALRFRYVTALRYYAAARYAARHDVPPLPGLFYAAPRRVEVPSAADTIRAPWCQESFDARLASEALWYRYLLICWHAADDASAYAMLVAVPASASALRWLTHAELPCHAAIFRHAAFAASYAMLLPVSMLLPLLYAIAADTPMRRAAMPPSLPPPSLFSFLLPPLPLDRRFRERHSIIDYLIFIDFARARFFLPLFHKHMPSCRWAPLLRRRRAERASAPRAAIRCASAVPRRRCHAARLSYYAFRRCQRAEASALYDMRAAAAAERVALRDSARYAQCWRGDICRCARLCRQRQQLPRCDAVPCYVMRAYAVDAQNARCIYAGAMRALVMMRWCRASVPARASARRVAAAASAAALDFAACRDFHCRCHDAAITLMLIFADSSMAFLRRSSPLLSEHTPGWFLHAFLSLRLTLCH